MMKKTIMVFVAAMAMSTSAMAQENVQQQQNRQFPQMDRTEMMKTRTEEMVKEYGLDEEQAKKLLELNTQYAEKIPFMMMGRGQRPNGQRPQAGAQRQRPQQGDTARRQMQRPGGMGMGMGNRPMMDREEMQKNMEAYNTELGKILTEEQFKKYQENQAQRMQQRGPRGERGDRPQRMQREQRVQ